MSAVINDVDVPQICGLSSRSVGSRCANLDDDETAVATDRNG